MYASIMYEIKISIISLLGDSSTAFILFIDVSYIRLVGHIGGRMTLLYLYSGWFGISIKMTFLNYWNLHVLLSIFR